MQAWTPAFHLSGSVIRVGSGLGHPPNPPSALSFPTRPGRLSRASHARIWTQELDSAAPGTSGRKAGAWGSPTSRQASRAVPILCLGRQGYLKPI